MSSAEVAFPVVRWLALAWVVVFLVVYWRYYGAKNLLWLCDIAVVLTCLGLWTGSALLLSSQAVSTLFIDLLWLLDVVWRRLTGKHLVGGTEYLWERRCPLWVRLLSFFHLVWPPLLLWALARVGYDARGYLLQAGLALVVIVASRLGFAKENYNFAHRAPLFRRQFGPAPVHLALTWLFTVVVLYGPTHWALSLLF